MHMNSAHFAIADKADCDQDASFLLAVPDPARYIVTTVCDTMIMLTDPVPSATVASSSRLNTTSVSDQQQQCKSESLLHWITLI